MTDSNVYPRHRFVVLNGLHVDRSVYAALQRWAQHHELQVQDAIQFALCLLLDDSIPRPAPRASPVRHPWAKAVGSDVE